MDNATRFARALRVPVWQETLPPIAACAPLSADTSCDLAVIGGGFTGLWTALKARARWPHARIALLEAAQCGNAASGRNGGFCAPSISHGVLNAVARWPDEAETLVRLGRQNLDALAQDLDRMGIDAEFERNGKLTVAATPWQADGLRGMQKTYARFGISCDYLEGGALRERFNSPVYRAGLFEPNYALVNPAKLIEGLRQACIDRGVSLYENTAVTALKHAPDGLRLTTPQGLVFARQAVMATNAARPLLKRFRLSILPIFDYSLVTEPLTDGQLAAIGWLGRHGIADSGNQFHYFRKTADNRILWGGYDAIYHYGNSRDPAHLNRHTSFEQLASTFAATFPALNGVVFSHAWGGIIDTSARTTFFAGTACHGQLAYALGFTGQGVSASRFAALTMLDMLEGLQTERTTLRMLRSPALPFPPEPIRTLFVKWAQHDLAREDRTGRRSLMLRGLDRLGIGFAS
ncbi:MAG: FAD-dependent oxidoreductase [Albidovulum sp.]